MRITRNDFIAIAKRPYCIASENAKDDIDYLKWVDFMGMHSQYFTWYENMEDGKTAIMNIDKVPDWAKERVRYSLNKKRAYCTNLLMPKPTDLVVAYSSSDMRVGISLDKDLSKKVAKILLSMATYLDALLLKDGKQIIDEQLIKRLV